MLVVAAALALPSVGSAAEPSGYSASGGQPVLTLATNNPGVSGLVNFEPRAISCPADGDCAAVMNNPSGGTALALEVGGQWQQPTYPPLPATINVMGANPAHPAFTSVACWQPGDCVAVGGDQIVQGQQYSFSVTSTNNVWGPVVLIPAPAGGQDASLQGVSCTDSGECISVGGYYRTRDARERPMYDVLIGDTWSAPEPAPFAFSDDACPALGSCVAAGVARAKGGTRSVFISRFNGSSWSSPVYGSEPRSDAGGMTVDSLSCPTSTFCALSTEQSPGSSQSVLPYISTVNGEKWTGPTQLPLPSDSEATASAYTILSCWANNECLGVGTYTARHRGSFPYEAFADFKQSGRWVAAAIATERGYNRQNIYDLSCPTASGCTASGAQSIAPTYSVSTPTVLSGFGPTLQ
jgi:hypothetical protein